MPLSITTGVSTLCMRRSAYERSGITRTVLDQRFNLTDQEFRVERDLVVIGPLYDADALAQLVEQLEGLGLVYFDDFFEMSGSWPEWLSVFVASRD